MNLITDQSESLSDKFPIISLTRVIIMLGI